MFFFRSYAHLIIRTKEPAKFRSNGNNWIISFSLATTCCAYTETPRTVRIRCERITQLGAGNGSHGMCGHRLRAHDQRKSFAISYTVVMVTTIESNYLWWNYASMPVPSNP